MYSRFIVPLILLSSSVCSVHAQDWPALLEEKAPSETYALLWSQQKAWANNNAPTIVSPDIKSIVIGENDEPLLDVRTADEPRIIMLPDAPDGKLFAGPQYNSGTPHASKIRKGVYEKLRTMIASLDELAPDFGYIPGTLHIKIFEALRDISTQTKLFNGKKEALRKDNPDLTEEELEAETSKWVSPIKDNVPVHSTGAAVDLGLWNDHQKEFLDMGTLGAVWGKNSHAPTFSENTTDEQKQNRAYCLMAAHRAGLVNYLYEFWHFSAGDRYAAYWQEPDPSKRKADYGAVFINE